MDDEVERVPPLLERVEGLVERLHVRHVAIDQQVGAKLRRQRPDALFERLALVGKGQLGALLGDRARNPPGERPVVGEAHDQPALALHQSGQSCGPPVSSSGFDVLAGLRLLDLKLVGVRPGIDFAL